MPGILNQPQDDKIDDQQEPAEGTPEEEARPDEQAEPTEQAEPDAGQGEMTPQAVRAKMALPPELQDAYERVVLAGMKIMFSPETHEKAMKALETGGPVDSRLGQSVAALIGLLIKESNNTMPPQVIIPAGIELVAAAGDYLKKSGTEKVTDDDIAGAMAEFVQIVLAQVGGDTPDKMRAMLQGAQQGGGAQQAPPEAAPQEQPPAGGPPQGLLAGA